MLFIEKLSFKGKTYLLKDWVTVTLCILQLVSVALASSWAVICLINLFSKFILFLH